MYSETCWTMAKTYAKTYAKTMAKLLPLPAEKYDKIMAKYFQIILIFGLNIYLYYIIYKWQQRFLILDLNILTYFKKL